MSIGTLPAQSPLVTPASNQDGSNAAIPGYSQENTVISQGLNTFAKMALKNPIAVSNFVPSPAPSPIVFQQPVNTQPATAPFVQQAPLVPPQTPPLIETSQPLPITQDARQIAPTPVHQTPAAPVIVETTTPAISPLPEPVSVIQEIAVPATTEAQTVPERSNTSTQIKAVFKWLIMLALTAQGLKGLFDSLYFILVEFQNFEQALVDQLVETSLINQLILKAGLLIFTTALSVFFALQLSITNAKQLHWLKIIASAIVGVACFFVLRHANTIQVLDIFKR